LNMSAQPQNVNFSLKGFGVQGSSLHVLLAAPQQANSEFALNGVKLQPFGVVIAAVQ
jgi:hypothetical protein